MAVRCVSLNRKVSNWDEALPEGEDGGRWFLFGHDKLSSSLNYQFFCPRLVRETSFCSAMECFDDQRCQ